MIRFDAKYLWQQKLHYIWEEKLDVHAEVDFEFECDVIEDTLLQKFDSIPDSGGRARDILT